MTHPASHLDSVPTMSTSPAVVPEWLRGCWRRAWIEFADGTRNDTDHVVWLQTERTMADVRVSGARPAFIGVASFEQCSPEQLAALATSNASTGYTAAAEVIDDGERRECIAQWFTYGHGANFQPECTFPEPGLLEVSADGTVMIERAPSGAYTEEWHLVPGSRDLLRHERLGMGRERFTAGPVVVEVRDRAVPMASGEPFTATSLDCEFSVAMRDPAGTYRIVVSTLPWREGASLDVTT